MAKPQVQHRQGWSSYTRSCPRPARCSPTSLGRFQIVLYTWIFCFLFLFSFFLCVCICVVTCAHRINICHPKTDGSASPRIHLCPSVRLRGNCPRRNRRFAGSQSGPALWRGADWQGPRAQVQYPVCAGLPLSPHDHVPTRPKSKLVDQQHAARLPPHGRIPSL